MRHTSTLYALALAAALAACSQQDDNAPAPQHAPEAISFDAPHVGKPTTRSMGELTTDNIRKEGFRVWGFHYDANILPEGLDIVNYLDQLSDEDRDVHPSNMGDNLYRDLFGSDGTGVMWDEESEVFSYDSPCYWNTTPGVQYFFNAFAGSGDLDRINWDNGRLRIESIPVAQQIRDYTGVLCGVSDYVVSEPVKRAGSDGAKLGPVQFNMSHILSKLTFTVEGVPGLEVSLGQVDVLFMSGDLISARYEQGSAGGPNVEGDSDLQWELDDVSANGDNPSGVYSYNWENIDDFSDNVATFTLYREEAYELIIAPAGEEGSSYDVPGQLLVAPVHGPMALHITYSLQRTVKGETIGTQTFDKIIDLNQDPDLEFPRQGCCYNVRIQPSERGIAFSTAVGSWDNAPEPIHVGE